MGLMNWFRRARAPGGPTVTPGGSRLIVRDGDPAPPVVGVTEHQYLAEREGAYRPVWGEPKLVSHELVPLIPHIDVYVFPPGFGDRTFYTLVTGGMSDLRMHFPAEASRRLGRAELVLYVREPRDEYIEMLRTLAHHPHNNKGWMTHGYTIPNGHPPRPMFPDSELSVVLMIEPIVRLESMMSEVLTIDGDPVELLWVVPITERECALKLQHGTGALMGVFNDHGHPLVLDERRRSYV